MPVGKKRLEHFVAPTFVITPLLSLFVYFPKLFSFYAYKSQPVPLSSFILSESGSQFQRICPTQWMFCIDISGSCELLKRRNYLATRSV